MSVQTTIPFDEQVTTPEEEMIPEVITHEASSVLTIDGKPVAEGILMKPNFTIALSESNKRYLDQYEVITDYVGADPELWEKYGVPEEKRTEVMLIKNVDLFPLDFIVSGYDKFGSKKQLPAPEIVCVLKEEDTSISREEAIKVLADWLYDNDYCIDCYDEMMALDTVEEAIAYLELSKEDLEYGELLNPDDEWEKVEYASLHLLATMYVDELVLRSNVIYSLLAKRYEECGVILVDTRLAFGFDEECDITLCEEVGTPDESTLASKMLYEKDGELTDMLAAPVLKYFESIAYAGEKGSQVPDVPSDVLDEVSDTCMYMAESLCDDLSFDINL